MDFNLKYTSEGKKTEIGEDKKTILSNDAFALGELLQEFIDEVKRLNLFLR